MTEIPVLGGIGHTIAGMNLIVMEKPKSGVSESFRSVRSNLEFFTSETKQKVFLVTSSIGGEGKTFCSMNLSLVFAMSGKRTILLGADLRKPKIYMDFELHNEIGLSNFLAGRNELDEIIQPTGIDNFDIITGGPIPPNPSELLTTDNMAILIDQLKPRYDYIIIDTPPLGLVTDAFILMKFSDHNLYLVRQNFTPKDTIKNVDDMYETGKIEKISILFNDVKVQHYAYGYEYSYGYYEDHTTKSKPWSRLFRKA